MLLQSPTTEVSERVLTAINWYTRANAYSVDDSEAIPSLAVALEALLGLPRDAKTERFVDAVSLLLGRVARLNLWADQFYAARSDVAHEGRTVRPRLKPAKQKSEADGPQYQSLLVYGRQIFQLCVGAVLFGAHLADRTGLRDKLVTNQERFEIISKILSDETLAVVDRFWAIDDVVAVTDEFKYVSETGLRIETMLGAAQSAANNLLLYSNSLDAAGVQRVSDLAAAKRSVDWYDVLGAVYALHGAMASRALEPRSPEGVMWRLMDVIWHYTFMHYFWLRDQRAKAQNAT